VTALDATLEELTIDGFHAGLRRGELSAAELVDWYLARIEAHDRAGAELHAVVSVNPRAHEDAAACDAHLASRGELSGPLHGVPVLIKDQFETADLRTTFGSIIFEDYVPVADATVVAKLRQAGAIILAKTAMCDFAAGWFSSSSVTGHTKNPYRLSCDSGGSSAGTAAGVAANFGLVGIGEDTGGSIRVPASFNNLFGLRVTTGLISRAGVSPLVHFQDTPAPIGRTVADVAALLDSIVGYDAGDPFTVTALAAPSEGGYAGALASDIPLSSWRIGVLETGFGPDASRDAAPVNRVVRSAIATLDELGVLVTPHLEIADVAAWIDATSVYARRSKVDLSAFLSARASAPVSSFAEIYESGRFHSLNDLFHTIAQGPDSTDGDVEYLERRLNQEHFRRHILGMLADHHIDFIACPTVQVVPPRRDELGAERHRCLAFPTNTVIAAQAGLPALSIPAGFTDDGLPVGLELIGAPLAEARMLQFARGWEMATGPRKAPAL
jgi:Asp-tRNA(Asn)/Glu-tRNA(Gln) amidotransferase A subunit family amidase